MRVKLLERDIQRAIVDYLEAHGALVLENRSAASDAVLNRVSGNRRAKGSTDLVAALPGGVTWWIEVKRPGAKLSREQEEWSRRLKELGHCWILARDVEDIMGPPNLSEGVIR